MSAYLVTQSHIDVLVYAATISKVQRPVSPTIAEQMTDDELGRMLWFENMLSLQARYEDPIDSAALFAYHYAPPSGVLGGRVAPVVLLKMIACYEYQACEHAGWDTSKARDFCNDLRKAVIMDLPGYDAAPWGHR